ncbi:excisionase family protein [Bifidobacterium animalis subsp. animalis]|uniref:helix-turn-helix domain-containing protein n=1 Tax=Bifidobacterium animalis TaxID=28025 RepID=UPI00101EA53E|nr:helix-turn-helix domain-containing protein [Bifidobacterium animalis]RYN15394.1 excisionase family protein [Bifidobacterium animalis subsp. animalis]
MTIEAIPISQVQSGTAYLTVGDGKAYVLNESTLELVMQALTENTPETAIPNDDSTEADDLLTTGEAAHILGVSSKTVGRILDAGEIPYVRYTERGNRWVSRANVLAYRENAHKRHRDHLRNMQEIASEGDLDAVDYATYLTQFE